MTTNTDVFIAAVLDRSGSMNTIWAATTEAFDGFVADQAKVGQGWISLTHFDDVIEMPYRAWALADLPKLSGNKEIHPRGSTAMYDAIGDALDAADKWLAENPWFAGTKVCMVQTDGYENSSTRRNQTTISAMIRDHEAAGWTFLYLGANQDAWAVAQSIGMTNANTVSSYAANNVGTQSVIGSASSSLTNARNTGTYTVIEDES